jgi:cysteinyl-tRNA synthetase
MRRQFEVWGYQVTQVMNFTDIGHIFADQDQGDDKMVSALQNEGLKLTIENLHILGKKYARSYLNDLAALNIKQPHHLPYASKHIEEDIKIIKRLIERGFAYVIEHDAIYFDTGKLKNYDYFDIHGDLDVTHARVKNNTQKRSPRDFSLWKFADSGSSIGWESPWGIGFPGWHIECSAMAWRYLGESFDIHTGGIEHIAVHHTNEIAQSETAFDSAMANYWLHNNHLHLNGQKISKSVGNVMYLDELEANGYHPADFRYLILTSHYRSEQNLTTQSLNASRSARRSLWEKFKNLDSSTPGNQSNNSNIDLNIDTGNTIIADLLETLSKDLDTPNTLAGLRKTLNSPDLSTDELKQLYIFSTDILGIDFSDLEAAAEDIPAAIMALVAQRDTAKKSRNYDQADEIRKQIYQHGFNIIDTPDGTKLHKRT